MPSRRNIEARRRRKEAAERRSRRRKVMLFLVEGESEVRALETPIAALIDTVDDAIDVRFQIMCDRDRMTRRDKRGGDVTSKQGVTPDTIEYVINRVFLTPFFREFGLYPRDILRVVQIIDTDGAFVGDELVVKASPESTVGRIVYEEGRIVAADVDGIRARNAQKRENLRRLASMEAIKCDSKTVPFGVYFFSANLDHYLFGEANLEDRLKVMRAKEFADACVMRPSLFFERMQADEAMCGLTYGASWEAIQEGTASLERHSNLGLLLKGLTES